MYDKPAYKKRYLTPVLLQQAELLLECNLMASVVDKVQPVETAGQQVGGEYDFTDYSSSNALDHEWGQE